MPLSSACGNRDLADSPTSGPRFRKSPAGYLTCPAQNLSSAAIVLISSNHDASSAHRELGLGADEQPPRVVIGDSSRKAPGSSPMLEVARTDPPDFRGQFSL